MAEGHDVGNVMDDAGYDSKANWSDFMDMGIEGTYTSRAPQLKKFEPRTRYKTRNIDCLPRRQQMRRILEIGGE